MKFLTFVAVFYFTNCFSVVAGAANYNWLGKWRVTQTQCSSKPGAIDFAGNWINFRYGKDTSIYPDDPQYSRAIMISIPYPGTDAAMPFHPPEDVGELIPPDFVQRTLTQDRFFYHQKKRADHFERYAKIEMIGPRSARAEFFEAGEDIWGKAVQLRCTHIFIRR